MGGERKGLRSRLAKTPDHELRLTFGRDPDANLVGLMGQGRP